MLIHFHFHIVIQNFPKPIITILCGTNICLIQYKIISEDTETNNMTNTHHRNNHTKCLLAHKLTLSVTSPTKKCCTLCALYCILVFYFIHIIKKEYWSLDYGMDCGLDYRLGLVLCNQSLSESSETSLGQGSQTLYL